MQNVVIIGVGECVQPVPENLANAQSPLDMMERAARLALSDCGIDNIGSVIDEFAVVRTFSDSSPRFKSPLGDPLNPPRALAQRIGINPAQAIYSEMGGDIPQVLVNEMSRKITSGACRAALLVGGEALANQKALLRAGHKVDWSDETDGPVETRALNLFDLVETTQINHQLFHIPTIYTLLENVRRARLGMDRQSYIKQCAELFAPMSSVAASHPTAMFKTAFSADAICDITKENSSITDIYSRALVSKDGVNQGAAVLLMSEDLAISLGVNPEKFVYPTAGSHVADLAVMTREDLGQSKAMQLAYESVVDLAGLSVSEIDMFDMYSCFPIAVFSALENLGLSTKDTRSLTVTGGLPFFGGPGNNYSMHAIVNVVERLRQSKTGKALIGANGGFLSKHAVGLYGREAPKDGWAESDKSKLGEIVKSQNSPLIVDNVDGTARVESYAVEYNRKGPVNAYIIGRLDNNARFLSKLDHDQLSAVTHDTQTDILGARVNVSHAKNINISRLLD